MKTLIRHILTAFILALLLGGVASAMPGHNHQDHSVAGDTLSPFEAKHEKRLHCELLGHNPLLPCPHHRLPADKKSKCFLATDCGGGPFQAPTSQSAGKYPRFLTSQIIADGDLPSFSYVLTPPLHYDASYVSSFDRPPQAL